jgi:hypothetical protein
LAVETLSQPACPAPGLARGSRFLVAGTANGASITWADARIAAEAARCTINVGGVNRVLQGYLAHPKGAQENTEAYNLLGDPEGSSSAWIGATDSAQEGLFLWAGGPPWITGTDIGDAGRPVTASEAAWSEDEPNNLPKPANCVALRGDGWLDFTCGAPGAPGTIPQYIIQFADLEPPTVTCPADSVIDLDYQLAQPALPPLPATQSGGRPNPDDNVAVTAADASLARDFTQFPNFAPQLWIVRYVVADAAGLTAECISRITVRDVTKPTITCQGPITVARSAEGTIQITATATDQGDGPLITASCNQPGIWPAGTTRVTCSSTDRSGNTNTCTVDVTITEDQTDTTAPVITCQASPVVLEATSPQGATYHLTAATATDEVGGSGIQSIVSLPAVLPTQFPLSGGGFTQIKWTATDNAGNTASCTVLVTVRDTTPPTITCPATIVVNTDAGSDFATNVQIPVQVSDIADPNAGYSCVPSGGKFSMGVTPVVCTAKDAAGNKALCSTSVAVSAKVLIDVRPGKCPNLVKFPSYSLIPIAILGSATFDVTKIVLSSLRLDNIPADPDGVLIQDFTSPFKSNSWWAKRFPELRCARKDRDGFKDLRVYFNQTLIANTHRVTRFFSVAYLTVTGQLQNGLHFEGKDIVVITSFRIPPRPHPRPRPGDDHEDDRDDDDDRDCEYTRYRQERGDRDD